MLAAQNGHDLCARVLVEAGAAVDQTEDGWTALMFAAQNGHDLCARVLFEAGSSLAPKDQDEFTALMLAAKIATQNGHDLCARILLEAGAAVNATLPNGEGNGRKRDREQ